MSTTNSGCKQALSDAVPHGKNSALPPPMIEVARRLPTSDQMHARDCLAHGYIQRNSRNREQVIFFLQPPGVVNKPLLCLAARATSPHSFEISSADSCQRMATLKLVSKSLSMIHFSLKGTDGERSSILDVFVHVPSVWKFVRDDPTRMVTVAVTNGMKKDEWKKWTKEFKATSGPTDENLDLAGVPLYTSKQPTPHTPGARPSLNFKGRACASSNKNMQLVAAPGVKLLNPGKVGFQMGRANADNKDIFNVDYAGHISPLAAFGVALAQLSL